MAIELEFVLVKDYFQQLYQCVVGWLDLRRAGVGCNAQDPKGRGPWACDQSVNVSDKGMITFLTPFVQNNMREMNENKHNLRGCRLPT